MQNYHLDDRQRRFRLIIVAYPFVLTLMSVLINIFAIGVSPFTLAAPSTTIIYSLVVASVLLVVNHSWLMTATELVRLRFKLHATPEEWAASGGCRESAPTIALSELERVHNAHRNATENTLVFAMLSLAFVFSSPTSAAAIAWCVGFAVARLGYTYCYLTGKDRGRSAFMTLSLLAMYGVASYVVLSMLL